MIADFIGGGIEAGFGLDEFTAGFEEVDELVGAHVFGGAGVEACVGAEALGDGVAEGVAGEGGGAFEHHLHDFVAVDLVGHGGYPLSLWG